MKSGIYGIRSPSGKWYIGSTKSLRTRRNSHFWELHNGSHRCAALQRAYRKYGPERLEFVLLAECEISDLLRNEQMYMRVVGAKLLYNSCPVAGRVDGVRRSAETRAKQSALKLAPGARAASSTRMKARWADPASRALLATCGRKNTSGFPGVSKHNSRWRAYVMVDGRQKSVGVFDTPEAAAVARQACLTRRADGRKFTST
jgi:group I intron endonuclease